MTEATPDLVPLISRLAEVAQQRAELEVEEKTLREQLRPHLTVGERITIRGNPVLTLRPFRRFDPDLAKSAIPEQLLPLCTVTTVDSKRAKDVLPPAIYRACQAEYEPRVVLL